MPELEDGGYLIDETDLFEPPIESKSKGLTPDQKKLHWENYALKTARQEEAFKKVFDNVFTEQKNQVVAELERTGHIPNELNDDLTAKKFQPAIELVYHSAFEDAV